MCDAPSQQALGIRVYHMHEHPSQGILLSTSDFTQTPTAIQIGVPTVQKLLSSSATRSRTQPEVYKPDLCTFSALPSSHLTIPHTHLSPTATHVHVVDIRLRGSALPPLSGSWFGVGIARAKTQHNHGTLWRTALQLGAGMIFTIGARYRKGTEGNADVFKTYRQVPCIGYKDAQGFFENLPVDAVVVAVEFGGECLTKFVHPKRAVYVLGSEDNGVPKEILQKAHKRVSIPVCEGRPKSMNVAAAGSVVLYDRFVKEMDRMTMDTNNDNNNDNKNSKG